MKEQSELWQNAVKIPTKQAFLSVSYLSVSQSLVPKLYLYVGGKLSEPSLKPTKHFPAW